MIVEGTSLSVPSQLSWLRSPIDNPQSTDPEQSQQSIERERLLPSGNSLNSQDAVRFNELAVVVEREFVGVRTQADRNHFVVELVLDPVLDEVFREDAAHSQEVVIGL